MTNPKWAQNSFNKCINQLVEFWELFQWFCDTLPVFSFNSARYDVSLIRRFFLHFFLLSERDIVPIVIKKAYQLVLFNFSNVQILDNSKFLVGVTNLGSFLEAQRTSETKRFFPYECFNNPDEITTKKIPSHKAFQNKLQNQKPLEKEYHDYEKLICSGLTTKVALLKLRLSELLPTWAENYIFLQ